jgi:hypothetical protein
MAGFKGTYSGKTFNDREKGEERRFEMEQDRRFKAEARRNRLLGRWLAERFGMTSKETEAYEKEVVLADLEQPGVEDIVKKVMADIKSRRAAITENQVRAELDRLYAVALQQIAGESKSGG